VWMGVFAPRQHNHLHHFVDPITYEEDKSMTYGPIDFLALIQNQPVKGESTGALERSKTRCAGDRLIIIQKV